MATLDRFFDEVRSVFDKRDKEYASRFFGAMYPGQMAPSDQVIERSQALLEELGDELVDSLAASAGVVG